MKEQINNLVFKWETELKLMKDFRDKMMMENYSKSQKMQIDIERFEKCLLGLKSVVKNP